MGAEPVPENAREIDERAKSIYHYNMMLKEDTTGLLPRDSITVAHAAFIASVERLLRDSSQSEMMGTLYRAIILSKTTRPANGT